MIVASWNVNSISVRLPHILEWLQEVNPDVVCLQETKSVDEKFPLAQLNEAGYQCSFFGERAYNGVAILSKLPAENIQKGFIGEQEPFSRRFIEAKVGPIYVLNCYIPNGQAVGSEKYEYKLRWLESLKSYLHQHKNSALPTVLCGDFNICPLDVDICKPEEFLGTIMCSDVERQALDEIKNWALLILSERSMSKAVSTHGGIIVWAHSDATWASVSTTSGPLPLSVKKFLAPGSTNRPEKRSGHQIMRRSLPNFQFDASSISGPLNRGGLFCLC